MSNERSSTKESLRFGWTGKQKAIWTVAPLMLSTLVLLYGPLMTGVVGTIVFLLLGVALGLLTWFASAGWAFKLEMTPGEVKLLSPKANVTVPMDKIGALIRNGGFPFPTLWLVLRGAEVGSEIPSKGLDPVAASHLENFRRRNPGKKITIVPIAGGHLRSVEEFVTELKRRIPPLTIDQRLGGN